MCVCVCAFLITIILLLFVYCTNYRLTEEQFWKNYFYRVSLIKQSLQANSAALKEPEQEVGAEHLPHDSEQKNDLVGKAYLSYHLQDGRVIHWPCIYCKTGNFDKFGESGSNCQT